MEIILQQDYPALGFVGDRVSVKSGYARNFLIPQGVALEASSRNAKKLKHHISQIDSVKNKKKLEAEERKTVLESLVLNFKLKIGAKGKSFGSISAKDISLALKEMGYDFDRRQLKLSESIKSGGAHEVEVKLHSDVVAVIPIQVEAEIVKVKEESGEKTGRDKKKAKGKQKDSAVEEDEALQAESVEGVEDLGVVAEDTLVAQAEENQASEQPSEDAK